MVLSALRPDLLHQSRLDADGSIPQGSLRTLRRHRSAVRTGIAAGDLVPGARLLVATVKGLYQGGWYWPDPWTVHVPPGAALETSVRFASSHNSSSFASPARATSIPLSFASRSIS